MKRLFIGVEVTEEISKRIEEEVSRFQELASRTPRDFEIHWSKRRGYHLTLKFLGMTGDEKLSGIRAALRGAVRAIEPFTISFSDFGVFPAWEKPRIFWVGLQDGRAQATAVANGLEELFQVLGFDKDKREYSPHLTVAKIKRGGFPHDFSVRAKQPIELGRMQVTSLALYESAPAGEGSRYQVIERFNI